jgi:hypothetical protein
MARIPTVEPQPAIVAPEVLEQIYGQIVDYSLSAIAAGEESTRRLTQ